VAPTVGTGPFGRTPAGTFNFRYGAPRHVLHLEDSPRRVRMVVAGETVADSTRVTLLHETGRPASTYRRRTSISAPGSGPGPGSPDAPTHAPPRSATIRSVRAVEKGCR
jgi:hypothetical protein